MPPDGLYSGQWQHVHNQTLIYSCLEEEPEWPEDFFDAEGFEEEEWLGILNLGYQGAGQ